MTSKVVYLDSGVLINAFRGTGDVGIQALEVLNNTDYQFATSPFVQLETLPKAAYHKQQEESEFYQSFFSMVELWATDLEQIIQIGNRIACTYGLNAIDALHLAAGLSINAQELNAQEFVTRGAADRKSWIFNSLFMLKKKSCKEAFPCKFLNPFLTSQNKLWRRMT